MGDAGAVEESVSMLQRSKIKFDAFLPCGLYCNKILSCLIGYSYSLLAEAQRNLCPNRGMAIGHVQTAKQ